MNCFKAFIIFLAVFSFCCKTNTAIPKSFYDEIVRQDDSECEREKLKVTSAIAELAKFRISNEAPLSQDDKNKIYRLVENLKAKEDLIAFAKIAMILKRHSTSDECFYNKLETVFDYAFWRSIELLAEDKSEENMKKMKRLKEEIGIGDADGYVWSTIVDRIPMP